MAKIGLKYPIASKLTEGDTDTYSDMTTVAKAIKADIKIDKSDAKLYADDTLAESDTGVTGGTITLEVDELADASYTFLLGHTKDETSSEITCKGTDIAPYVGFGFYGMKLVNNTPKYRAVFFPKVKFSEPDDSNETKKDTTSFQTQTIEGKIILNSAGVWKYEETFDKESDAKEYIEKKNGDTSSAS